MKRTLASLSAPLLLLTMMILPAAAASDPLDQSAMLPVDIILNQEAAEIRKVYDLSPNTDPSTLPREPFERDGLQYTCTDILREVIVGSETQALTQTETVESTKKDTETVLSLLPQEKEVTTEDGFAGTLRLNLDSLKTAPSGYGSKTSPVTATRSYPNLSDADTQYIPKTVEDSGLTLSLQDVQWQTDNTHNADDYEIGDRFTAVCTYGGSKTSSYVKGYTTTADYTGEVYRTGVTVIRYTVIFNGATIEPVETPAPVEDPEPAGIHWAVIAIPAALIALALGAGGAYLLMKHGKERKKDEEAVDDGGIDDAGDGSDDDAGPGSGVSDRPRQ